jgi:uncharacterized protein YggE
MMCVRKGLMLLAGLVLAGATSAPAQEVATPRHEPEIVVSGTGTVSLAPDYAVVRVSVVTRDDLAARAGEENAGTMNAVRAALKRLLGVPDDSLPTVSYSVDTQYDRGRPNGYQATSTLEAHTTLARVGAAIDAALGAGATNIAQLRFESTKREAARLEALGRAVQRARREAEAIAHASGGHLGNLISATSTGAVAFEGPQVAGAMRLASETPITAGPLEVSATVTARWAFVPE